MSETQHLENIDAYETKSAKQWLEEESEKYNKEDEETNDSDENEDIGDETGNKDDTKYSKEEISSFIDQYLKFQSFEKLHDSDILIPKDKKSKNSKVLIPSEKEVEESTRNRERPELGSSAGIYIPSSKEIEDLLGKRDLRLDMEEVTARFAKPSVKPDLEISFPNLDESEDRLQRKVSEEKEDTDELELDDALERIKKEEEQFGEELDPEWGDGIRLGDKRWQALMDQITYVSPYAEVIPRERKPIVEAIWERWDRMDYQQGRWVDPDDPELKEPLEKGPIKMEELYQLFDYIDGKPVVKK